MGRTEKNLIRLRDALVSVDETLDAAGAAAELEAIAVSLPKADRGLEPVLGALARLAGSADDDAAWLRVRAGVDAALEYAARRDHPRRDSLLEAAAALAMGEPPESPADPTADEADAGPAAEAGEPALPPGFVGELPPESTLEDALVLLVQLEPGDRYGIGSLVEIVGRLAADATRPAWARALLDEVVGLLTGESVDADTLGRVGELLEAVSGDEPVGAGPDRGGAGGEPEGAARVEGNGPSPDPVGGEGAVAAPEAAVEAPWRPGPDADADLLREFLVESRDLLGSAEQALLALEADPGNGEAVNVVFRAFHTIKGTSAFLGIDQAAELCHHAEGLLSRVRDGAVAFGPAVADLSLRSGDLVLAVLDGVGVALDGGTPAPVAGLAPLVRRLQRAAAGEMDEPVESGPEGGAPVLASSAPAEGKRAATGSPGSPDASVRVRTDRLDRLVDMVGELVIAHSMIAQDGVVRDDGQHDLAKKVGHAGKIVRELQDLSMALRMVPLRSTYAKLQRLVRDLARKSGKRVELRTEGEETEIDRTMVDILGDPLVHMIRNAVDHGVEGWEERKASGKPEVGTLWLRSYHAGGNVVVELEDDGRGMDRARIVAKAVERGLIRSGDGMTDGEVWKLVFEPGFSTAAAVTDVSGRGVGMDVVRRNIESLRGRIEVDSSPGAGTKVTLRLPLTLAITEGMLMRVGPERYILPTLSIERNIRPTPEMLSTVSGRGEMLMLRDELLPIVRLHRLFGVKGAQERLEEGLLVVVGAADRRCALLVDELLGQQQVVVKSLGDGLGKVEGVTGGAVLGDGTVGLILDAIELVTLARLGRTTPRAA